MSLLFFLILGTILFFIFNFLVGIFGFQMVVLIMLAFILAGIVLGH